MHAVVVLFCVFLVWIVSFFDIDHLFMSNFQKMNRFNHLNIKQEHDDDMNQDENDNINGIEGLQHEINKGSFVNRVTGSVLISTHPQPTQQSVQSCTKIKKEEESCEIKLEWDGDECDCLECRVEREIKIEFNQTNATETKLVDNNYLVSSEDKKGKLSQCKRVKKEEEDEVEEWDEDCDCDDCRRMKLRTITTVKNEDDLVVDSKVSKEYCDDADHVELDEDEKSREVYQDQISEECEGNETEINDDEYEMDIDGEESSDDDEKTEMDEQSDRELNNKSLRNNKPRKGTTCGQCGKTLSKPSHLTRHLRTHTAERPFKCPWEECNKTFVDKRNMTRHLQIHTGEQPHVCERCGQKFRYQLELTVHIRAHTGERPFKCPWNGCNKAFARNNKMQSHLKIHTGNVPKPRVCEHCDKRFSDLSKLTRHIRTHTGERPFACSWNGCSKTFARKDSMFSHYKSHTGQLPQACQ